MTESHHNAQEAPQAPLTPKDDKEAGSEHRAALKAYLLQLETRVRALENWKDSQPCFIQEDGKWVPVPPCFD